MRASLSVVLFLVACGGSTGSEQSDDMAKASSSSDAAVAGAKYAFSGPSATATLTAGQTPSAVTIASSSAYPGSTTFTFSGAASASGTLTFSEAYNHAVGMTTIDDVMPDTLSSAQSSTTSAMLYYSVVNAGAAITVPSLQLAFVGDAGGALATYLMADISCEVAFYSPLSQTWTAGGMVSLASNATSFTIASIQPSGPLSFASGQTIFAVRCD